MRDLEKGLQNLINCSWKNCLIVFSTNQIGIREASLILVVVHFTVADQFISFVCVDFGQVWIKWDMYRYGATEGGEGGVACVKCALYGGLPGRWAEKGSGVLQAMHRTREGREFVCVRVSRDWKITVYWKSQRVPTWLGQGSKLIALDWSF